MLLNGSRWCNLKQVLKRSLLDRLFPIFPEVRVFEPRHYLQDKPKLTYGWLEPTWGDRTHSGTNAEWINQIANSSLHVSVCAHTHEGAHTLRRQVQDTGLLGKQSNVHVLAKYCFAFTGMWGQATQAYFSNNDQSRGFPWRLMTG